MGNLLTVKRGIDHDKRFIENNNRIGTNITNLCTCLLDRGWDTVMVTPKETSLDNQSVAGMGSKSAALATLWEL